MQNMSAMLSQVESRPTMPHQPNEAEDANGAGLDHSGNKGTPLITLTFSLKYCNPYSIPNNS